MLNSKMTLESGLWNIIAHVRIMSDGVQYDVVRGVSRKVEPPIVRTDIARNSPLAIVLMALSGLGILEALIIATVLIIYRNSKVIKASSPELSILVNDAIVYLTLDSCRHYDCIW